MPYHIISKDGQYCVAKQGQDAPIEGGCHGTEEEARQHMAALYANEADASRRFTGMALIRAREDDGQWILDVRAVPFGVRDSYGTIWDENTELHQDKYPGGIPAVYYHGLDDDQYPADSPEYIGLAKFREKRQDGAWYEVILDKTKQIAAKIWKAAREGMAAASVGGVEYLVRIDETTGHVDEWPVGELSIFETYGDKQPSIPYAVALPALRATYQRAGLEFPALPNDEPGNLLRGDARPRGAEGPDDITTHLKGLRAMDIEKLKEIISTLVSQFAEALIAQIGQLAGGGEGESTPPPEAAEEMRAEALKTIVDKAVEMVQKDSGFRTATAETVTDLAKQVLEANRDGLFEAAAMAAVAKFEARRKADKEAADRALAAARAAAPPLSVTDALGGHTPDSPNGEMRISGVEDLRYAHLGFEDMALFYQMRRAQLPEGMPIEMKTVVSESFLRAMVAKAVDLGKQPRKRAEDTHFMRAASLRANEVDTTANTGYGPEWVGQMWSTILWEKARAQVKLYEAMIAKGMWEQEVPEGASTVPVQTEGSDPVAYTIVQNADVDATNRPSVEMKISPFGTGTVALAPGEIGIASAYKIRLEEDSAIPVLPQLNRQLVAKAQETIEQAMLNGDTETAQNTNINLIDGTPGTGLSTPYYINNNGMLKYPLVTNTSLARSAGGQFALEDFRLTLKLLANQFREQRDKLLYFMDGDTHLTALAFPEFATIDVRGAKATIESGYLLDVYKIDVLTTGFMALANSAGKIPTAGGTLGRLGLAYAPYWAFGWKRQVRVETAYDVLARTNIVVATMRFDVKPRGADASAVSYNIGIS